MKRPHPFLAALAILFLLQLAALLRAPAAHYPERIALALAPGATLELGRRELAAPQAAQRQLALRRAADGSWWLRNLQPERAIMLFKDGVAHHSARWPLHAGQRIGIGAALFTVDALDGGAVTFASAGQRWHYDGATVRRNGDVQPPCPDATAGARLQWAWNRWAPRLLAIERPLAFGGNLHCGTRIGIAWTEPGSALVRDGSLWAGAPLMIDGADPRAAELPLAGVDALAIGRTRFALDANSNGLHLAPQRDVLLAGDRDATLPPQVRWTWTERGLWTLPEFGSAALLVLACGAVLAARRYPGAVPAAIVLAGVAAIVLQRAGMPPGLGWSMLLGWSALSCFALLPRRLGLAGMAALLLLAVGMLAQLELGLGAPSANWARHFHKTCALLAVGLGLGSLARLHQGTLPSRRQVEILLGACALAALCALGLQVLFGDETGVFDVQPVEFAKLALAAASAHCLAVGLGWHAGQPETLHPLLRWLRLGAPVLLLASLCGLALVQVNDYSPLLLLLVWGAAMTLAWAAATRRIALAIAVVAAGLALASALHSLRAADGGQLAAGGFYADRFAVWRDPASHPHTGQQMLLAGRAIADGGWLGADRALGLASLGQPVGAALAIPAVQDDFAPSFFIHRHGLAGALILWLLQAAFVAGLVRTAALAHLRAAGARDFRLAWLARFQCFFLAGGAAFVGGHLLLSWGTNLAILPIMGQPMSFLSAGGSHLLFFICPLLTIDAMSGAPARQAAPAPSPRPTLRRSDHAGVCPT